MAIKQNIRSSFWFNLLVVLLLCLILYILFFASLKCLTRHGEEEKIPNVTGLDLRSAMAKLDEMGFAVYVDSTYEPLQKPYAVLKQMPDIGSIVKKGRTVFITVNKAAPPATPMPNLNGVSFRSAVMVLKSNKLALGDTTYKPDVARDAVLQMLYNGAEIKPGQMIPAGSKISLVLGNGLGITEFPVPDVTGMTYDVGTTYLSGSGLQYTVIWDAPITDSASAIIYDQTPKSLNELGSPNRIKAGDIIDLRIRQTGGPDNSQDGTSAPATNNNSGNNTNNNTDVNNSSTPAKDYN
jgi:beta-lactam-binding protein with PASTA domain